MPSHGDGDRDGGPAGAGCGTAALYKAARQRHGSALGLPGTSVTRAAASPALVPITVTVTEGPAARAVLMVKSMFPKECLLRKNFLPMLLFILNYLGQHQIHGGARSSQTREIGGLGQLFSKHGSGTASVPCFENEYRNGKYARRSIMSLRLRGGKEGTEVKKKKRMRRSDDTGQKMEDENTTQTGTMLYQPGADGFGEVKVVPEYHEDDIPNGVPEGTTQIFEVNLTALRAETESSPQQFPSRSDWYITCFCILLNLFIVIHISVLLVVHVIPSKFTSGGGMLRARRS